MFFYHDCILLCRLLELNVTQVGLTYRILLAQPSRCWDSRPVPLHLIVIGFYNNYYYNWNFDNHNCIKFFIQLKYIYLLLLNSLVGQHIENVSSSHGKEKITKSEFESKVSVSEQDGDDPKSVLNASVTLKNEVSYNLYCLHPLCNML